jgi:UDP-N-acetylglucosamine 1-carboxyvinyltransferase
LASYVIRGGRPLMGEVRVSGSKNAALGIIPAAMLLDGPCRIENLPDIADVNILLEICRSLGARIRTEPDGSVEIDPRTIATSEATHEKARSIRASYYLMGALLGRFRRATLFMPGGCDFGTRPIDQHIKGFEAMGGTVKVEYGKLFVEAERLTGEHIFLDVVSVGATINLMIAAAKAEGVTVIENAAREPHIVDVANFLNTMGANIKGAGTDVIKVTGVPTMPGGFTYSVIPDQIEAGTYMVAAAATGGDVVVRDVIPKHMEPLTAKMAEIGVLAEEGEDWIRILPGGERVAANVKTMPYPGFPTDLQPQTMVLLCLCEGVSRMTENVWENRFQFVDDLKMMGANVSTAGHTAIIEGPVQLTGATVTAHDLRAGAAMVLAGLAAEGTTEVCDVRIIERGYENLVGKLRGLGADIARVEP